MEKYLILVISIQYATSTTVPVVILDPTATLKNIAVSANPFQAASSASFVQLVEDAIHLSDTILIFVEDHLSVEDISRKDNNGSVYSYMHKSFLEEKAKYMPSVIDPTRALERRLPPMEGNVVYLRDERHSIELNKDFKYLYVYFEQPSNDSRSEVLRRHDELIMEAYEKLVQARRGPTVVFYTGKRNPMLRLGAYRRPPPPPAPNVMKVGRQALIRLAGVVLQQGALRSPRAVPSAVSAQTFGRKRLATRMRYAEFELDFNFEYLRDSWLLDSVVLLEGGEEVGRTPMGVGAPYDWSFYCSEPLMLINTRDKSYVTIARYQVEPLRRMTRRDGDDPPGNGGGNGPGGGGDGGGGGGDGGGGGGDGGGGGGDGGGGGGDGGGGGGDGGGGGSDGGGGGGDGGGGGGDGGGGGGDGGGGGGGNPPGGGGGGGSGGNEDKEGFTNTVNCGTNFNCRILAGLFVTFTVLAITMWGVQMMFDCRSNDRVEDPNQKPLVIVAQL